MNISVLPEKKKEKLTSLKITDLISGSRKRHRE